MVKVYSKEGKEIKFDKKDVEDDLRSAGLPERVAKEVADRVDERVQDGWTLEKVRDETDIEMRRLEEDIERAHASYKGSTSMGEHSVGEQRASETNYTGHEQPRSETKTEFRSVEK